MEVHPIQFTLYLDDKDITAPFKVSDLFICKNTLFSFTEIELEVEMNCNRISIMKEKMKLNDYIFNIGDKPYLQEKQRYIIKARACSGCNELKYVNQRVRNVLIVTGMTTYVSHGIIWSGVSLPSVGVCFLLHSYSHFLPISATL